MVCRTTPRIIQVHCILGNTVDLGLPTLLKAHFTELESDK